MCMKEIQGMYTVHLIYKELDYVQEVNVILRCVHYSIYFLQWTRLLYMKDMSGWGMYTSVNTI